MCTHWFGLKHYKWASNGWECPKKRNKKYIFVDHIELVDKPEKRTDQSEMRSLNWK